MLPDLYYTIGSSFRIIISVIGIAFCVIIIVIAVTHQQCRNVINLLGCNTCVAVSFYLINAIVTSIYSFREDWAFYAPQCVFRGYCLTAGLAVIGYSYSIQAICRLFFAVFYKHKHLQTYRTHWIMIIIQWFIGLLVPVVPFFIKDSYELEKESRACRLTSHTPAGSLYGTITIYVAPLSAVVIVYGIIFYRVRQSTRRIWAIAPTVIRLPANNNVAAPNMK
ncbi:unnamed protein product, partial [Rotaria sp. Silwood1]